MKRFLLIFLVIACLTAAFCPAFAAVECTVPKELSGGTAAPDVPMLGGEPEETAPAETVEQANVIEAAGSGLLVILAVVILAGVILAVKLLAPRTGNGVKSE